MAMKLGGLADKFQPGLTLLLPVGELAAGVEQAFVVPLASAQLGAWCHVTAQAAASVRGLTETSTDAEVRAAMERVERIPSEGDLTLAQRTLGRAYDEMVAAGVLDPFLTFAGATAFVWILAGEEKAEEFWNTGGSLGKANNRGERRAQAATRSTRTDGAARTPQPASTSGTSDPRTSRQPSKARRSRGTR